MEPLMEYSLIDQETLNPLSDIKWVQYKPATVDLDLNDQQSPNYNLQFESYQQTQNPVQEQPLKTIDWFNSYLSRSPKIESKDSLKGEDSYQINSNAQTNLNGWNIDATMSYLQNGRFAKHTCAGTVETALTKGGLKRFRCTDNGGDGWAPALHYNGILSKNGWTLVSQGEMNGYGDTSKLDIKKGDICIQGNNAHDHKNAHAAIFDGSKWQSDYHQNHMMAYGSHGKVKYFIYRYTGTPSKKYGGILKFLNGNYIPFAEYKPAEAEVPKSNEIDLSDGFNLQFDSFSNLENPVKSTPSKTIDWFNRYLLSSTPTVQTDKPEETPTISNPGSVDAVLDKIVKARYNTHDGYKLKVKDVIAYIPKLNADKKKFIDDRIASYKKYGCDDTTALVYAVQDGLESGYGKDLTGKNNIGGIKNGNKGYQNYSSLDEYTKYKIDLIERQYKKYSGKS